jgi:hypothetical protein
MRFGKIKESNKTIQRSWFAFLPVTVHGETRWLEKVTVEGYWWYGPITNKWWWEVKKFIDK